LADGKILIVEITVNHNVLSNRIAWLAEDAH
jgi:hypothetical protein